MSERLNDGGGDRKTKKKRNTFHPQAWHIITTNTNNSMQQRESEDKGPEVWADRSEIRIFFLDYEFEKSK
jgi:hypothetical protein